MGARLFSKSGGWFFPRWRRDDCVSGRVFPRNGSRGRYAPLCTPRTCFFSKKQAKRCDTRVHQKSLLGLNPAFAGFRLRPCGPACGGVVGAWLASEPSMIAHFGAAGAHIRVGGEEIGCAFADRLPTMRPDPCPKRAGDFCLPRYRRGGRGRGLGLLRYGVSKVGFVSMGFLFLPYRGGGPLGPEGQ